MSTDDFARGSSFDIPRPFFAEPDGPEGGLFGPLPQLSRQKSRDAARLRRLAYDRGIRAASSFLADTLGPDALEIAPPEILWRPSGLRRSGVVAQVHWPRLSTRFGIGIETPLAHAVVDHLLGFERPLPETRLHVSPVEWGILTYFVAEALHRLGMHTGPLGAWDVWIDRVGPDAFDTSGMSRVVTVRWPIRIGNVEGSFRLWLPGPLVEQWVEAESPPLPSVPITAKSATWGSVWRAVAGTIALPRGLRTLRPGGVLPLFRATIRGTPQNPEGHVELRLKISGLASGAYLWPTKPVEHSGGAKLRIHAPWRFDPTYQEPTIMSQSSSGGNEAPAVDVPVTLVVELGRVNLPLSRLADLRPGDVIELQRHTREPIELTSNGRPVARGELVQIDADLGVRITQVYL